MLAGVLLRDHDPVDGQALAAREGDGIVVRIVH
jgi:hypothetical protein